MRHLRFLLSLTFVLVSQATLCDSASGDSLSPTGSVVINKGAESTNLEYVYLILSATDDVGVTGYFISNDSTKPTLTSATWKNVVPKANYSGNTHHSLKSGNGTKTVYVWYKDAAGNISNSSSDSIVLAKNDSWKNYYGIAWDDTNTNHTKYAKQMGYDYIAIKNGVTGPIYKADLNNAGLKFYFIDPITYLPVLQYHSRWVSTTQTYTQADKDWYEKNMVWKSNDKSAYPFPNNLASGYFGGVSTKYNVEWDWQQQRVIDEVVDRVIALVGSYQDATLPFTFAGILIDVPSLRGEFLHWDLEGNKAVYNDLSFWTGKDSCAQDGTGATPHTHEYATYRDGKAAYLKKLSSRMKEAFPNSKLVFQPWRIYSTTSKDEWLYGIKDRADKDELTPEMLSQENSNTEFVDNASIFNSGVNITKDRVENTQHTDITEYQNRLNAAKAGINGAWYNWFGSFMAAGTFPNFDFQAITEVYPRLKLIRVIPNWDNLSNVPLANRSWDGSVYRSTRSYISSDVMYSRHWKTGKLFAVFNTNATSAVVKLNLGESVASIRCVDGYFIETTDCFSHFNITPDGKEFTLKSSVTIPIDTTNGQVKGSGYIFAINSSDVTPPAAPTNLRVLP